jgi:hypothetical protein
LRSNVRRLLAVALIAGIPTMLAPVLTSSTGSPRSASVAADAALAAPLLEAGVSASGGAPMLVPERVPGIAAGEQRSWLRSVSTSPVRPRLPRETSAPPHKPHLTWNARLRIDEPAPDALARTLATPGVRFATPVFLADVVVRSESGRHGLRVAFADPGGFRVFTPKITGEAEPLWHGLREGQALFTHHAARRAGIRPGDEVTLSGSRPVTVVGSASLGTAHVADVVVSAHAIDRGQFDSWAVLLAGVEKLGELGATAARLEAAGVGDVQGMRAPVPYQAELTGDHGRTVEAFEPFTFVPAAQRGWLRIDPAWVARNITRAHVPLLGEVVCHRLMVPQLHAALAEVSERGLAGLIDPDDYGGCFAPRHIGRNPHSSLSMHAWGLAVDFNVHTNLMGEPPRMDPRIIEIFERHGFNWGGRWRTPDGMHFELGVLAGGP